LEVVDMVVPVNKKDKQTIQIARKYRLAPGTFKCEVFLLFDQGFKPREVKFILREMKVDPGDRTFSNTISRYYYTWKQAQKKVQ
jgi:hypothetical protein